MNSPTPIDRRALALAILACFIACLALLSQQLWLQAGLAAVTCASLPVIGHFVSRR